jgi:hypothetical protein
MPARRLTLPRRSRIAAPPSSRRRPAIVIAGATEAIHGPVDGGPMGAPPHFVFYREVNAFVTFLCSTRAQGRAEGAV